MADKKETKPENTKPEENKDNKDEKKDQTIRALDEGDIHILRTYVCIKHFGILLLLRNLFGALYWIIIIF